ncbi:hypothetical protein CYCD_18910 [Tenuifilaceae bacterium CYCD]|nr:hypothetical protein CYCD_18910 [Tenuifilaceae bacterium CYCD]
MNNKTNPLLISSMTYGLYLGIIMVIYSLLLFFLNVKPIGFTLPILLSLVSLAIAFFGIFLSTKKVRNDVLGGEMTFGQGILIGLVVIFVASVISAIYVYIQSTIIDPDYMKNILEAQKEWMYEFMSGKGVSEEQIEKAIEGIDAKMNEMNPVKTAITSIVSSTIFGLIISLITSAILKKKNDNPFVGSQVME